MLEHGKISARQLFFILVLIRFVPVMLLCTYSYTLKTVQIAWLNDVLGVALSLLYLYLFVRLCKGFKDKTIIEYLESNLGPVFGKIIGIILVIHFFIIAASDARDMGETFTTTIMPETPIIVFILIIVFLGANAARNGLEVIARISEFTVPIILLFLFITISLNYKFIDVKNLKPFYFPQGFSELVQPTGSILSLYIGEFIIVGMIFPYLNKMQKCSKSVILATLFTGVLFVILCIDMIVIFGPTFKTLSIPILSLAKLIFIANFIERIEGIVILSWVLGSAIKIALFLWATAVGTGQILKLKSYQPLIYPLGALATVNSILNYERAADFINFFTGPWIVYSSTLSISLLIILYIAQALDKQKVKS
ncbi:MAG: spore germination protein [Clostridia bacterium]|nr:spore germination protein [Clostridia bacterium]